MNLPLKEILRDSEIRRVRKQLATLTRGKKLTDQQKTDLLQQLVTETRRAIVSRKENQKFQVGKFDFPIPRGFGINVRNLPLKEILKDSEIRQVRKQLAKLTRGKKLTDQQKTDLLQQLVTETLTQRSTLAPARSAGEP
jgi:hypothetical protein